MSCMHVNYYVCTSRSDLFPSCYVQTEVTPLMWAAYHGNVKLAEILLASGAKVDLAGQVRYFETVI